MRDELNAHLPPGPNPSCLFRWLFFFLLLSILPTVSLPVLLHSPTQAAHFLHYIPKAPWIFYHAWDNQPQDSQFLRPRLGRLLAFVKRYPPSAWAMLDKVVWCPLFAVICFFSQCEAAQPSPPMLIILLHSKSSTLPASSGHNLFVWSLRAEFSFLSICRLHCFCSKPALVRQKHWLSLENSCQSVCAKIPPEQSGGCLSGLIAILWADLAVLKAKS